MMQYEVVASEGKKTGYVGKRLYPPGWLAAYTILANVPLGLICYGSNIMARGHRLYGKIMIGSGLLTGICLLVLILSPPFQGESRSLFLIGLICGMSIYKLEEGPYQKAITAGALRARWWPPLLFAIGIMAALYLYMRFAV